MVVPDLLVQVSESQFQAKLLSLREHLFRAVQAPELRKADGQIRFRYGQHRFVTYGFKQFMRSPETFYCLLVVFAALMNVSDIREETGTPWVIATLLEPFFRGP